jgi:hypothetical protein
MAFGEHSNLSMLKFLFLVDEVGVSTPLFRAIAQID